MVASIPASALVAVTPSVIAAGGSALDLSGLALTNSTRVPFGAVQSFPSLAAVGAYFGVGSAEYTFASFYFGGFDTSTLKPGALLFAQYPAAPVSAYLRGGSVAALTLPQLQAISGTLSVTVDGTVKSGSPNLSAATSFTNAATILSTALTATVTYDAQSGGFVVTSGTTGATSTIGFASGTAVAALKLAQVNGAVTSQGAIAGVPGANMAAIIAAAQNFATFSTVFEPVSATKVLFAEWNNAQNNRFLYVPWDSASTGTVTPDTTSFVAVARSESLSGYAAVYDLTGGTKAAFIMGAIASLDFGRRNGRATMAYRSESGLTADVTDATTAANLTANGYNFYGAYATANANFTFLQPGQAGGPFKWIDSYINQIKLNSDLQLALLGVLTADRSLPYSNAGYAKIEAACQTPIVAAVTFGTIRAGVTLSASQIASVNAQAGTIISDTLQQRGWYLQVLDPGPSARAARGSPIITLWYVDGGSVQTISLASINVQ